jgi:hypothetical protein
MPQNFSMQDELSFDNVKRYGRKVTEEFLNMVADGQSVKMAEMLATRKAPSLGITDQTYMKNKPQTLLEQFGGSEILLNAWNTAYRAKTGEDIPSDAFIFRGLANGIGDPAAVLSHKNSLSDIQRVMRERNVRVEGDWEIEPVSAPPVVQETRMAPDLVQEYVDDYISEDPSLASKDRRELEEMVIDRHSRVLTQSDLEPCGVNDFDSLADALYKREREKAVIKVD